jgi:hypothetical protein
MLRIRFRIRIWIRIQWHCGSESVPRSGLSLNFGLDPDPHMDPDSMTLWICILIQIRIEVNPDPQPRLRDILRHFQFKKLQHCIWITSRSIYHTKVSSYFLKYTSYNSVSFDTHEVHFVRNIFVKPVYTVILYIMCTIHTPKKSGTTIKQ